MNSCSNDIQGRKPLSLERGSSRGGPCYFANVHVYIEGGDMEGTYSVDEDGNLEPL